MKKKFNIFFILTFILVFFFQVSANAISRCSALMEDIIKDENSTYFQEHPSEEKFTNLHTMCHFTTTLK